MAENSDRPFVNGARLAGDIAQRTPLDPLSSLLNAFPCSPGSLRTFQQLSQNSFAGESVVLGGINQDFSRKVLGLSQGAAGLLGEQTYDL